MKKLISLFLAVCLILPSYLVAGAPVPKRPIIQIVNNELYVDGGLIDSNKEWGFYLEYEVMAVSKDDYPQVSEEWYSMDMAKSPYFVSVTINPRDVLNSSLFLAVGDVLYFRRAAMNGELASPWTEVLLEPTMFSKKESLMPGDATLIAEKDFFELKSANVYSEYEYAIVNDVDKDLQILWENLGSVYEYGSESITVKFLPRSTPYTIYVRLAGDNEGAPISIPGVVVTEPEILYDQELLGPLPGMADGATWYFSTDGGTKWTEYIVAKNDDAYINLSKVFGKNKVNIQLKRIGAAPVVSETAATPDPNEAAAAPTPNEASATPAPNEAAATPTPNDAAKTDSKDVETIVLNVTVKARPEFPKTITIKPIASEQYPQNWTFNGVSKKTSLEYAVSGSSDDYIGIDLTVGLPLLSAQEQAMKIKASKYMVRIPANPAAMTPASLPKRFTQPKQTKTPTYKIDYKKEIVKTKSGAAYYVSDKPLTSFEGLEYKKLNDDLDVSDIITKGLYLYMFNLETDKKARSAIQTIQPAKRYPTPDNGEAVNFDGDKGKVKLNKGYEAMEKGGKWGGLPKGAATVMVRRKSNAKFNARTGMSTGYAASLPLNTKISYTADKKMVTSVSAPSKEPVQLWELNLNQTENCAVLMASELVTGPILQEDVYDYVVCLTQAYETNTRKRMKCDFSLQPIFKINSDGTSTVEEVSVNINGGFSEILPDENGVYRITGRQHGDIIEVTLKPSDENNYRETTYTIKIDGPPLPGPSNLEAKQYGNVIYAEVTMNEPIKPGYTLTLNVWITTIIRGEEVTVQSLTNTYKYDPLDAANNRFFVMALDQALNQYGTTQYVVHAQVLGESGESRDSLVVSTKSAEFILQLDGN